MEQIQREQVLKQKDTEIDRLQREVQFLNQSFAQEAKRVEAEHEKVLESFRNREQQILEQARLKIQYYRE